MLRMVYAGMETTIRLEKSLQAMEKQAKGAALGFKTMMDENELVTLQLAKMKDCLNDDEQVQLSTLLKENSSLTVKVKELEVALEKSTTVVSMVKKQAERQSTAYMALMEDKETMEKKKKTDTDTLRQMTNQKEAYDRLVEENAAMKNQLEDYDLIFTDQKKKDN